MAQAQKKSLIHPRYWLTWLGVAFLALLGQMPLRWVPVLGRGLGRLVMKIGHSRVSVVRTNLALCFPEMPEDDRETLLKQTFQSAGVGILESLIAWFSTR